MGILIKNIRGLAGVYKNAPALLRGKEMDNLPMIENAFLAIKDTKISEYGSMGDLNKTQKYKEFENIDASGRYVIPSWCDSHTHLVFAESRELEFEDRIKGLTYEQVAKRGGGILNSAAKLASMSESELFDRALPRLLEAIIMGTGAMEIKSGYGLSTKNELKMLRVIKQLQKETGITIKSSFLGAHAIAADYAGKRRAYIDLILEEMIPAVAEEKLADYVDAFCEEGYFSVAETMQIVARGAEFGMKSKIHVNQFNALGAIAELVKAGAVSVDHLEVLEDADIKALDGANTIATALPLCSLFLSIPYTQSRRLIDNNAALALASDYNPGSAPSSNMSLAVSLACIKMKMTPAEAINAATLNGAAAMEISDSHGSITPGKVANVLITEKCEHLSFLPYSFGKPAIAGVINGGRVIVSF